MLYLNLENKKIKSIRRYLTLTSVVFECINTNLIIKNVRFNFNKCCIWMATNPSGLPLPVLFNFNKCCIWMFKFYNIVGYPTEI